MRYRFRALCNQVLQDWFGGVRVQKGQAVQEDVAKWAQRCRSFLNSKTNESNASKRLPWNKRYLPNEEGIRAFDAALLGTGLSLSEFELGRKPGMLTAEEKRYFVSADDLPDDVARDIGLLKRSCIENTRTGATHLEVCWEEGRKLLVNVIDCGSRGRPSKLFLYGVGGLRGICFFDAHHTRYNRFKSAVDNADLADPWAESGVVCGFKKGPWTGCAHFQSLKSLADNYFETANHTDMLYRMCYPCIMLYKYKGNIPLEAYTEPSYEFEWVAGRTIRLLHNKGSRDVKSRWFDKNDQLEGNKEDFGWLRLLCLRRALEENWYAGINDSPLFRSSRAYDAVIMRQPDAASAAPQAAASSSSSSSSSAGPNLGAILATAPEQKTLQEERDEARCVMHLTCNIMCTDTKLRLMTLFVVGGRPSKRFHSESVTMLKTQAGCIEWWAKLAAGEWMNVVLEEVALLSDEAALQDPLPPCVWQSTVRTVLCVFKPDASNTSSHPVWFLMALSSIRHCAHRCSKEMGFSLAPMQDNDPDLVDEMQCADCYVRLMAGLMKYEIQEGRIYSETFPYKYGALLKREHAVKRSCMEYVAKTFDALQKFERAAFEDDYCKHLVTNAVWPSQGWAMEVMITLAESNFDPEDVPPMLHAELLKVGRSPKSTKDVEDQFRELGEASRAHTAAKLGRTARWHRCTQSNVMVESDRKRLEVTSMDKQLAKETSGGKGPPQKVFQPVPKEKCTIDSKIDTFMGTKFWGSPPPDAFFETAMITHNMIHYADSDKTVLRKAYLSLLAEELTFLVQRGVNGVRGLVLASTEHGVLLWHGTRAVDAIGENFWFLFAHRAGDAQLYSQHVIENLEDYMIIQMVALPPCIAMRKFGVALGARAKQVLLCQKPNTTPMRLLEFAASHGLWSLNCDRMKKLANEIDLEWPKPKPRTEFEIARTLVHKILPALSELEVDNVIENWRGARRPSCWTSSFTATNVDHVVNVLDPDGQRAARERVSSQARDAAERDLRARRAAGKRTARAKQRPRTSGGPIHHIVTLEEAKTWLPGVAGCNVSFDDKLHMRWKVSYPNPSAPFTASSVWNEEVSSKEALYHCLRWAWECHELLTGESCPFNFTVD
jgi:hypothetical protein